MKTDKPEVRMHIGEGKNCMKSFQYGGQAVIEGVMMRGPKQVALAVRKPKGGVELRHHPLSPVTEKYPVLKKPILRGVVALFEALILGIKMLTLSANIAMEEEEEEELSPWEIALTITLAFGLAIFLFVIIPTGAAHFLSGYMNVFWQNVVEGILRIVLFFGYVLAISFMSDIKRVFQYHGAEHKVINAYESGEDLSRIEKIQKYKTLHPRCGTAFLLTVLVLTIFFYSFLGQPDLFWRIMSRILLLPIIAGVAYEFIKFSAKHMENKLVGLMIVPGLWLQKLTTREPDNSQVEVALEAFNAVLPEEEKIELNKV